MIKTNTNAIVDEEMLHDEVPFKLQVSNIQQLTDEQINELKVGDVVAKKTGNQFHSYRVSYKEDNQGICLTYSDASLVETVSYDYTEGHWVYNSTDVTELGGSSVVLNPTLVGTEGYLEGLEVGGVKVKNVPNVLNATSGTIAETLGLDASGNLVKGSGGGSGEMHCYIVYALSYSVSILYFTDASFTDASGFVTDLNTKYSGTNAFYPASGVTIKDNKMLIISGIKYYSASMISVIGRTINYDNSTGYFSTPSSATDTYGGLSNILVKKVY